MNDLIIRIVAREVEFETKGILSRTKKKAVELFRGRLVNALKWKLKAIVRLKGSIYPDEKAKLLQVDNGFIIKITCTNEKLEENLNQMNEAYTNTLENELNKDRTIQKFFRQSKMTAIGFYKWLGVDINYYVEKDTN